MRLTGIAVFRDRLGLPLTTASSAAADAYVEGLDRLLAYLPGADASFDRAAGADEAFVLPRLVQAFFLWGQGRTTDMDEALELALTLAQGVSRRERQQAEIMAAYLRGGGDVPPRMREHLADFPTDALVLHMALFTLSFEGSEEDPKGAIHELLSDLAGSYGDDWWFSSVFAMSHQEQAQLEEARRLSQQALDGHPGAAGGAHSMSHVFYETGDQSGGLDFLEKWMTGYDKAAPFRGHLAWHVAIFELARGDVEAVERLFAEEIAPLRSGSVSGLEDSSSLLWRQWIYGGSRQSLPWDELRELAEPVAANPVFSFHAAHAALVYAGSGDQAGLAALVDALRRLGEQGHPIAGTVVAPLAEGVGAFAVNDHDRAVACLEPVQASLARIGGSHLQREVFEDTLLVAYIRSGRLDRASSLLQARLDARPSVRDEAWFAETQSMAGNDSMAL